jgi:acetyl esterase/lipase
MDTQRAMSLLRSKTAEFGVKPERIGLFGFSAGGQVALIAATNDEARLYPAADEIDKVSCRPDFLMLCYAWHILADNSLTELKPEIHISAKTPPTFLAHTNEDTGVPAENSLLFVMALRKAKVPVEFHLFEKGRHGLGLGSGSKQFGIAPDLAFQEWPKLCAIWLKGQGFLDRGQSPKRS